MSQNLHFQVDSELALLLSQNYRSSEKAIKELIDNSWDAEADSVRVTLPEPCTTNPIIIEDDGTGMTLQELQYAYCFVANNRRKRSGELTPSKKRQVKGRKGIGKFAGFMAADAMTLKTRTRGKQITFSLHLSQLTQQVQDLESIPLELDILDCDPSLHGTTIHLQYLKQNIQFPIPEKLRNILFLEYGREKDFTLYVNGNKLGYEDISGLNVKNTIEDPALGKIEYNFTVAHRDSRKIPNPGIAIRVGGKVIGNTTFLGLDERSDFPPKLCNKIIGEVSVDALMDDVTADWGAILDNSVRFEKLQNILQPILFEKATEVYQADIKMAFARLQKEIQERISKLPENRREYANKRITSILNRFYDEDPNKAKPIVDVLLEAMERNDYRRILEEIAEAKKSSVAKFAEALESFGLLELSEMSERALERLQFLDDLDDLIQNEDTLEADVHRVFEKNLWVLGPEYSLHFSNKTLKRVLGEKLPEWTDSSKQNRPDLFLGIDSIGRKLLIEFKRPSHPLRFADYQQATAYRNVLKTEYPDIEIILMGGKRGSDLPTTYSEPNFKVMTYSEILTCARRDNEWIVQKLRNDNENEEV
jgi:hypothetical protein